MSRANVRRIALLEPVTVFVLIMAYIWQLRYSHHGFWLAILAGVIVSHLARHENTELLGFHRDHWRECFDEFAPALVFLGLAMFAAGTLLQTTRHIQFRDGFVAWA